MYFLRKDMTAIEDLINYNHKKTLIFVERFVSIRHHFDIFA